MAVAGEILVLSHSGLGHLFPSIELCKRISSRNFQTTLILPSDASSSIPSTVLERYPLFRISEIPLPPEPEGSTHSDDPFFRRMGPGIESMLSGRPDGSPRPLCVVVDVMMGWSKEIFAKFGIPIAPFFTCNASFIAMEYAMWKARVDELKPGETRNLPGLPEEMAVSYFDIQRPPRGGPGAPGLGPPGGKHLHGPPKPGSEPFWLRNVQGTIGLLMNTCHDLEGSFLDYVGQQAGKPVWGVGPLLPEEYWNSASSVLRDRDIRPKRKSSHSEEEVIQWLDAKPQGSVLYISFGSEKGPSAEENAELASALEESDKAFIWVVRPRSHGPGQPFEKEEESFYPHGLDAKVGERGLVIRGWAPQLMILGHPSTGGFLTHCGWNSTAEAIGRGVPMLAWPISGDQFCNTKLVASHLRVGHMIKETGMSEMVKKDDIVKGIEKLMGDRGAKMRAEAIRDKFQGGFPTTSDAALDAFKDFLA